MTLDLSRFPCFEDPEFDRLAARHTVVYFDNIGRGRSSDLPAGRHHSPERDAEDIERLRAALGFERIALLGHSYGGYPALAYAGRHPERLTHLVISSSGHSAESWQRNVDNVNRFVENQYPEASVRIYERSAHRPWVEEAEAYFERLNAFLDGRP